MQLTSGTYLPNEISARFYALDGSDQAKWLSDNGFKVVKNYDFGGGSRAVTECGFTVAGNGFVWKQ